MAQSKAIIRRNKNKTAGINGTNKIISIIFNANCSVMYITYIIPANMHDKINNNNIVLILLPDEFSLLLSSVVVSLLSSFTEPNNIDNIIKDTNKYISGINNILYYIYNMYLN